MFRKSISLLFLLFGLSTAMVAQEYWSLEECIQYAMENNIQIKQQVLNTEYNENLLKQSQLGQIPSLSGNTSYSYSWGRALDQTTYQFTDNQQINSISLGLSSSVNLFNGLQVRNTIQKNKLNLMASYEDVQKVKNDISLNIAAGYLTIMFNKELVDVTTSQIEITGQQVERTAKMVDAGKLARGNYLELQAQYSSEELNLVNAENQLSISLLNLQQMLDLPVDTSFDVLIPELDDPGEDPLVLNAMDVYEYASREMPEIKSAMLRMESAERSLSVAKGGRSPQLYMSLNANTGYSDIREETIPGPDVQYPIGETASGEAVFSLPTQSFTYGAYPFMDQMRDNMSTGVGLGLAIPIFSGWQINTSVANARISYQNAQLELQSQKLVLYATIQQAYADALAALKKFNATRQALVSMEESFKYTEKKFEVGMVNTVDYNMSKNQLISTQSDLLQAKYDFIFRTKILNFYQGVPITL